MKHVGVLFLCLLFGTAALADDVRRVELKIVDGNAPQRGVALHIKYPDGERTNGVTLELVTDDQGVAAFEMPAGVFWLTIPEMNRNVVGKEFRLRGEKVTRFTVRPREWKAEIGESQ
ncbi:MAG TPA: hypothetical protein VF266_10575 [Thermoanaerobaculia bacterium]